MINKQNHTLQRSSGLMQRYFYAHSEAKSTLLFVVLCSNKEQQKHCVVRELNQKACKVFQARTKKDKIV